ncbi:hypothetical protein FQR65_LT07641 [Abscondita terminalis]|nr:hypothetical protein FQR65_LT07641 [Abscondita terminalis]
MIHILLICTLHHVFAIENVEETCRLQVRIPDVKMMELYRSPSLPVDDVDYGKFLECVWSKRNVMDKDGNINQDNLLKFFKEEIEQDFKDSKDLLGRLNPKVIDCSKVSDSSPMKKGVKLKNCITTIIQSIIL